MGLNIKKIIQDLEEIEKPAEQLDNIFIEKGKELEFVNELELIALKSNVDLLLNSDFTGEIIDAGVSQVDIQATITGTYKQILEFIHSTESMDRYFNIKLITLSKNRSGDSNIVAQISGNTYFK
jgi:Tfp pilus assembly protein PilO